MKKEIRKRMMVGLILLLMLYIFSIAGTVIADCPPGECELEEEVKAKYLIFYWPCRLCKNEGIEPVALPREKPSTATFGAPIWNSGHLGFVMR